MAVFKLMVAAVMDVVYHLPKETVLAIIGWGMLAVFILRLCLFGKTGEKAGRILGIIGTAVGGIIVLCGTLIARSTGERIFVLIPFQNLFAERVWEESYRLIVMNVFLFFPLGIGLCGLWKRSESGIRGFLIMWGIGTGASLAVELLQLILARGSFETEDLICNSVGILCGVLPILPVYGIDCLYRFIKSGIQQKRQTV